MSGGRCLRGLVALLVVATTAAAPGCQRHVSHIEEVVRVPYTPLLLPKVEGWQQDPEVRPSQSDGGGVMLRLVQRSAVPGSPRVEVILEAKPSTPTALDAYTDRNLREMGQLEQAGKIHILHVEQQPSQIGVVPAWRVQHEYTVGQGHGQISLYQVSTFCVFNGRGITVTASGRTELFHPLAGGIAQLFEGMTFGRSNQSAPAAESRAVDLGKVGG